MDSGSFAQCNLCECHGAVPCCPCTGIAVCFAVCDMISKLYVEIIPLWKYIHFTYIASIYQTKCHEGKSFFFYSLSYCLPFSVCSSEYTGTHC